MNKYLILKIYTKSTSQNPNLVKIYNIEKHGGFIRVRYVKEQNKDIIEVLDHNERIIEKLDGYHFNVDIK